MGAPKADARPFTRLNVPDPATNRAIQDIYDKLQALTQTQTSQPLSPAPSAPPPPGTKVRRIVVSDSLRPDDQVISANITGPCTVLLPPTKLVRGLGPYTIQNDSGSSAALSLASSPGELVNGAAASATSLAAGDSVVLVPNPGYWIILSRA